MVNTFIVKLKSIGSLNAPRELSRLMLWWKVFKNIEKNKPIKGMAETILSKSSDSYGHFSSLSDESLDNSEYFSLSSLDFLPEEHIIISVSLKDVSNQYVPTFALIDSGATSNFVNESFVFDKSFPLKPLPISRVLKVVDGRTISSGKVTHSIASEFQIGDNHIENITLNVASIGQFPVILGLP
jgi:hypothetical protein